MQKYSDKQSLRIWAKMVRKNLNIESISKNLCKKICLTDEYKYAQNIMIFYPLKNEINLLSLLDDKSPLAQPPR